MTDAPPRPAVSIVIPSYHHEQFIEAAVDSCFGQTLQDIEIVVVDDGSKDRSLNYLRSVHAPFFKLIEQENAGAHVAINVGLNAARGRKLAVLKRIHAGLQGAPWADVRVRMSRLDGVGAQVHHFELRRRIVPATRTKAHVVSGRRAREQPSPPDAQMGAAAARARRAARSLAPPPRRRRSRSTRGSSLPMHTQNHKC